MSQVVSVILCAVFLVGCGSADPWTSLAVTSIPPGNATGTAASGELVVERQVLSCDGTCSVLVNERMMVFCTVGAAVQDPAEAEEADGSLKFRFERQPSADGSYFGWDSSNELPVTLAGGINTDQTFEVGGYLSAFRNGQEPHWPDVYARLHGRLGSDGMAAELATRRRMSVLADDGMLTRIDCEAHEKVIASRVQ